MERHGYDVTVRWAGDRGAGTASYGSYGREHEVSASGPPIITASADPAFRGDPTRWNPEQLMVAAISQCHMLWFLHLAAEAGVVVSAYEDGAHGVMLVDGTGGPGGGRFERVVLSPVVTMRAGDPAAALAAHEAAHRRCFIANSLNFPVEIDPEIVQSCASGGEGVRR